MNYLETIKQSFREIYGSLSIEEIMLNQDLSSIIAEIESFFEKEALV